MNGLGILWVIGWVLYCMRDDLPWSNSKSEPINYALMFAAWPIVMGVDAYKYLVGEDRKLITKLQNRLMATEDERDSLYPRMFKLDAYTSPDIQDAEAPADIKYVRLTDVLNVLQNNDGHNR